MTAAGPPSASVAPPAVGPFKPSDRARWDVLWRGYLDFYRTSLPAEVYDATWSRLNDPASGFAGIGVRTGGPDAPLDGIAHLIRHPTGWSTKPLLYLQDLFVDPALRGRGLGRVLIAAAEAEARRQDCLRLYWLTHETNADARALYDKVARYSGFVRYDVPL